MDANIRSVPRGRTKDRWLLVGALAALAVGVLGLASQSVLTGGGDPTPLPSASASPGVASDPPASGSPVSGSPALSIVAPADDAVVPAGAIELRVDVAGFRIVAPTATTNAFGEGHLIYYRDVDFIPTDAGRSAQTAAGTSVSSSELTQMWQGVDPGRHVFFVQLVNNDETPLSPAVFDSVVITVGGPSATSSSSAAPSATPSAAA